MAHPKISIRKGREFQLERGHPWLFSGGIAQAPGGASSGALVDLVDYNGGFVARGYYNPSCDIAVRVLTRNADEQIDAQFFEARLKSCLQLRQQTIKESETDVFRLVNAEGDFLPGYIVDYYAGVLVVQSHTAGGDALLPTFLEALHKVVPSQCTILRNDASVRRREGLEIKEAQVIRGELELPSQIMVRENSLKFVVNPLQGQKTGFYTDQRDKRAALATYASKAKSLLNCFSYTGSFSIYALRANPDLLSTNLDQSERALEEAKGNYKLNGYDPDSNQHKFAAQDAFAWLEEARQEEEQYDIVVVDPPAFAKSHKEKPRALKGYSRLQRLSMAVTKPGGLLLTCSCSGIVSKEEFISSIHEGAAQCGRNVQLLETFEHGVDHPVNVAAPETSYLKVAFCRVL